MNDFFPQRPATTPTIYAFASTHPDHAGQLKVGYTERDAGEVERLETLGMRNKGFDARVVSGTMDG